MIFRYLKGLDFIVILGGLFEHNDHDNIQIVAFRYAVEKVNSNKTVLPYARLSTQVEHVANGDSFKVSKQGKIKIRNNHRSKRSKKLNLIYFSCSLVSAEVYKVIKKISPEINIWSYNKLLIDI